MAANQSNVSSTQLFGELNRLIRAEEYEKAIKTSSRILQHFPEEAKAAHCKLVCQIHVGKFEDGLSTIRHNVMIHSYTAFEKAYCEYRLNRTAEALRTLQSLTSPDERERELLAQVLYRLERYDECFKIYKDLVKNTQDDFEEERLTNFSAMLAAKQIWTDTDVDRYDVSDDTYELCYNHACFLLGKNHYSEALEKLKRAEELCREQFEDDPDMTKDEIEAELAIIWVQKGYALQKLGQAEEALKLYNQVMKNRPSDIALAAVASNNIVTINKDQNVFDSKKKMKVATVNGLKQKLTSHHRKTIATNQCLLHMYTNQGELCKKTAQTLLNENPNQLTPVLIQAAQLCRDKQTSAAIDLLQETVSKSEGVVLDLHLTLAQLHLADGHVYKACDILRSLGSISHKPGVVATLVVLYMSQEDHEAAGEVLNKAVEWHRSLEGNSSDLQILMKSYAAHQQQYGSPQKAAAMLEQLCKSTPNDSRILAQLISAYSKFDPAKAQEVSRSLPSPAELAHDVDVNALEASALNFGAKYTRKSTKPEQSPKPQSPKPHSPQSDQNEAAQIKKRKKKKVPTATLR